jgi:uncharacterized protein
MLRFEWNDAKARANVASHGITFEEAQQVFDDPLARTVPDPDHSEDEFRFRTIGRSRSSRLLFVVHADHGDTIRIIGARVPTARERKDYEEDSI